MFPLMIRGVIIYVAVIAAVRLMGKRQIGELQPSELVITILLSQIASMPLENGKSSLLQCLSSVFLLVALEVLSSVLAMKSEKFRSLLQGHSVPVIKNGKLIQKNMKLIRFSVEDLIEALRLKDVFDIGDVDFAYVETNGALSISLKSSASTVTLSDLKIRKKTAAPPCLVISDGKIIRREFDICGLDDSRLYQILNSKSIKPSQVLLMTYSADGESNIVVREKDL